MIERGQLVQLFLSIYGDEAKHLFNRPCYVFDSFLYQLAFIAVPSSIRQAYAAVKVIWYAPLCRFGQFVLPPGTNSSMLFHSGNIHNAYHQKRVRVNLQSIQYIYRNLQLGAFGALRFTAKAARDELPVGKRYLLI